MNIEIPEVSKASGINQPFEPNKILESLLKETSLTIDQAELITRASTQFIISTNIKFLSGPLIREIVNVQLLQYGFEKARLEYTRIGKPRYELKKLIENNSGKEENGLNKYFLTIFLNDILSNDTIKEYEAVKKLIEER